LGADDYQKLKDRVMSEFGKESSNNLEKKKFTDNGQIKVPAAFLIELCGLKDLQSGEAAINQNQPLVIINRTGTATAKGVLSLADKVRQAVLAKTGIELKFEPELIGF
jgi:UDP-N-acetylmuramate dehydrogenase